MSFSPCLLEGKCEVAWDVQAHVRSYCFELLGFKHKKTIFQGFPLFSSYDPSIIFLSYQKCQSPKETLNMLYDVFVKITATVHENFP